MTRLPDPTTLQAPRVRVDGRSHRPVLLLYHGESVRAVPLALDRPLVIGRRESADLHVADPSLSRKHARFGWDAEGVYVEDLGSRNGTLVGGERVVGQKRLAPGDEVVMGDTLVTVQWSASTEELPTAVDGEDAFLAVLEHEVERARSFRRPLAVLMVRALSPAGAHVSRFLVAVRRALRPVDRVALHGHGELLVLVPELDDVSALVRDLAAAARAEGVVVGCGIALHPTAGTSAHQLVESARLLARSATDREPVRGDAGGDERAPAGGVVVRSAHMRELHDAAARVATHGIPVLVVGETGTGKEILARIVHERSARQSGPFRAVNCAAIPATLVESTLFGHEKGAFTGADRRRPGMFELAHEGTLFLDEIGELSAAAQASVLRVLETGRLMRVGSSDEIEVDVRLVTATHRDLEQMCERGEFRWDLLYRLNTFVLEIPPLRERTEEIAPLSRLFLDQVRARAGTGPSRIQPDAVAALAAYRWPGNVRELRNVVERAAVMAPGEAITIADLPPRVRSTVPSRREEDVEASLDGPTDSAVKVPATIAPPPSGAPPAPGAPAPVAGDLRAQLAEHERQLILGALERSGWNQSEAARVLQIPRRTLTSKMRLHGIRKRYESGG